MNGQARILLVEDDAPMRESCRQLLEQAGYAVLSASSPKDAKPLLLREEIDLVVTDLRMPDGGGQEVLRSTREASPTLPVIIITAYPTVESAVSGFKQGLTDYVTKPFTVDQLRGAVRSALAMSEARDRAELIRRAGPIDRKAPELIGNSSALHNLLAEIRRAAHVDSPVLITGETGSGKELVARCIHQFSRRAAGPFVTLACVTLQDSEKGPRLLELLQESTRKAEGGTLFLKEVSDLSQYFQAVLIGFISNGKSDKSSKSANSIGRRSSAPQPFRIIASTRKDLRIEIRDGRFREDTYYHLSGMQVRVPALRERSEDIPPLALHFLDESAQSESSRRLAGITDNAYTLLSDNPWPGNVRELRNAVLSAAATASGPLLSKDDLLRSGIRGMAVSESSSEPSPRKAAVSEYEKNFIAGMLTRHDGNVTHTAQALGIHRSTLQRLIKKHGLSTRSS